MSLIASDCLWLLDLLLYLPPLASAPDVPPAGLSRAPTAPIACMQVLTTARRPLLVPHRYRRRGSPVPPPSACVASWQTMKYAPAPPCECSSMHVLTTTPRPSPQVRGELLAAKKLAALRLLDASTEDGAFLFGPAESMAHWVVAACDGDTGVSTRCDCNSDCNSDCMLIASLIINRRREDCRRSSPEAPGSKFG